MAKSKSKPNQSLASKWTIGYTLTVISIIAGLGGTTAVHILNHQTKAVFDFQWILIPKQHEAANGIQITITNTGNEDIVIRDLQLIEGFDDEDVYGDVKQAYLGKTLKAGNMIQWQKEIGFKATKRMSFRIKLVTTKGKVIMSKRINLK